MNIRRRSIEKAIFALIIILNIYGVALQNLTNIPSIVFTASPILLFAICSLNTKFKYYRPAVPMFVIACIVMMLHVIMGGIVSQEIKYVLYIIVFMLIFSKYDDDLFPFFIKLINAIAIVLSLDALIAAPKALSTGFGFRNIVHFTLLDKAYYTFIITVAFILLFSTYLFNKRTYKIWQRICIGMLLGVYALVCIVLMSSKMFIAVIIISIFELMRQSRGKKKKRLIMYLGICVTCIITVFFVFPGVVPEYIYVFLNRYFGMFNSTVSSMADLSRQSSTYVARGEIYDYVLSLFLQKPLLGIGFGQYSQYAINNSAIVASQTESAFLGILVEGGALYFINHIIFLVYILKDTLKTLKKSRDSVLLVYSLVLLVSCIGLNIFNDYYSTIYWIILSLVCGTNMKCKRGIRINDGIKENN